MNLCDIKLKRPKSDTIRLPKVPTEDGQIVYVCTRALPNYVQSYNYNQIKNRFILVTGDSDDSPSDYADITNRILNNPLCIAWFAQNCDVEHPKLKAWPIGLDYHTFTFSNLYGCAQSPTEQESWLKVLSQNPWHLRKSVC